MRHLAEIQPGDWLLWRGYVLQLSSRPRCPVCNRPNACYDDHYAYVKWFYGLQRGVDVQDDDLVTVFESRDEVAAYREWLMTDLQLD